MIDPSLLEQARTELDRIDGTLIPVFVDVLDGWYEQRIVIDEPCVATWELGRGIPVAMTCHTEPCHIPRYRKELRWVPGPLTTSPQRTNP